MVATIAVESRPRFDGVREAATTVKDATVKASSTAVAALFGTALRIWDRLPIVVKWMVGGIVGIGLCYAYGYFVAYVTMAALLAMGMSFGWAYGITMAITLGSFYGLLMWLITSGKWD